MANTLRIKRSTGSSAPTSLANAELAYAEGNNILYYGTGTGGAGGSATAIEAIGGDGYYNTLSTAQTISGNKTFTGTVDLSGATIPSFTCNQNLTVTGNLVVQGTTTTVSSTTITIADKNIELAKGAANDAAADGGGITLDSGDGDKTWNWVNATDSWTSSEHIEVASGKTFRINANNVLSQTTLGSTVVSSSLTSVGTISTGVWSGTDVAVAAGGTGSSTASGARTNLGVAIGSDVQAWDAALDDFAGLTQGTDKLPYFSSATAMATADFTSYARTLLDDGDAATARATLGVVIGTNVQAYDAELAALAGLTSAANKLPYFTGSGTASVADFSAYGRSLVDDADAAAARSTLGLGTMATQNLNAVNIDGGTIDGIDIDGGTY